MLSITEITDADYYLGTRPGGSGCACAARKVSTAADYQLFGTANGEPPGAWAFRGANLLGLTGEIVAEGPSGEAFRTLVNELRDPSRAKVWEKDKRHPAGGRWVHPRLGRAPMQFQTTEARVEAWVKKNPLATPEQVEAYRVKTDADVRQAVNAWDLTFSPPKSWSVLHAALQWAGRHKEAAIIWECLEAGRNAALDQMFKTLSYTQHRPKGPKVNGKRTAWYERPEALVMGIFKHHTSRERDPQLHEHVMLLGKVMDPDGTWRALDATELLKSKHLLDATYLREAEAMLYDRLGYRTRTRVDGVAREIEGVSGDVLDFFSSRVRALTEKAEEWVQTYQELHGRPPSDRERWQFLQWATLGTRKKKSHDAPSREEELEEWEESIREATRLSFAELLDETDAARDQPEAPAQEVDRARIIARALEALQRKSTWSRSHLYGEITKALPEVLHNVPAGGYVAYANGLVDEAIASREVVTSQAPTVVKLPADLDDPVSGRSKFEAPNYIRYTTRTHLEREDSVVARLDHTGARVIPAGTAAAVVEDSGLGGDQHTAVVGIVSSGRRLEVVDAPAGAGKTMMTRVLSDLWAAHHGVGVIGFTLSQNAANVMRGEGIERAFNIARWRNFVEREKTGKVSDRERALFELPADALVVVDEASMVDTPTLVGLLADLDRAGITKVVLVGDTEQVDAVDAGGAFAMLVGEVAAREKAADKALEAASEPADNADALMAAWTGQNTPARELQPVRVHRLTEVRRFTARWEREASVALRTGDSTALSAYNARGRVKGDCDETRVQAQLVAGWLTDYNAGRDTVMVAGTEQLVDRLASFAREVLVRGGHVEHDGAPIRGDNRAGVGDLVQTRLNDHPQGINNRQVWQVVARTGQGELTVRADTGRDPYGHQTWGEPVTLAPDYVQNQVSLAYSGTVEAVQGRSTDTGHLYVDPMMSRSRAYPGLTRGRHGNHAYVLTQKPPTRGPLESDEEYAARARPETPMGRLASVFGRDDRAVAARVEIAAEQDRATNLGHLGPQWDHLVREQRAREHRQVLLDVLGPADAAAVLADPASLRLFGLLRSAELRGHEPAEVIETAMGRHTFKGARSPASLLFAWVEDQTKVGPLPKAVPVFFESRVPAPSLGDRENAHLEAARELGRAMDQRTSELGNQLAEEPPVWALRALGPVPDDPAGRWAWIGKVAPAAAYREMYGVEDELDAIGRRPTHIEPERAWLWDMAAKQIGMPAHERDLLAVSSGELATRVAAWEHTQAWLPRHVDADLRTAHLARQEADARVVEAQSQGVDAVEALADRADMDTLIAKYEEIASARAAAIKAKAPVQAQAVDAERELARRHELDLARSGEPLPPEPDEDEPEPEPEPDAEELAMAARAAAYADWAAAREVEAPRFGSREWVALADDDPAKRAAVTVAAHRGWNMGAGLERERVYAELDRQQMQVDTNELIGASAVTPGTDRDPITGAEYRVPVEADGDGTLAPPRTGDLIDERDVTERALAHEIDRDAPVLDDEPDDVLPVLEWAQPRLGSSAPAYGSPEYAALDDTDPAREQARVAAAMEVWNLGDDLDELQARTLGPVPVPVEEPVEEEVEEPVASVEEPEVVEEEPEPVVDEDRFQVGLAWTLAQARAAEETEGSGVNLGSEPEPEKVTPDPEPEPEVVRPEPTEPDRTTPEPVVDEKAARAEQVAADLAHAREVAAELAAEQEARAAAAAAPEPDEWEPETEPEPGIELVD